MSTSKVLDFIQKELASDQPTTTLMNAFKVMQPGIDRLIYDAGESARRNEREESVCRLLASGMTVEEVFVVLCIRRDEVEDTARCCKDKIAKYAKTLKERKKRHRID